MIKTFKWYHIKTLTLWSLISSQGQLCCWSTGWTKISWSILLFLNYSQNSTIFLFKIIKISYTCICNFSTCIISCLWLPYSCIMYKTTRNFIMKNIQKSIFIQYIKWTCMMQENINLYPWSLPYNISRCLPAEEEGFGCGWEFIVDEQLATADAFLLQLAELLVSVRNSWIKQTQDHSENNIRIQKRKCV